MFRCTNINTIITVNAQKSRRTTSIKKKLIALSFWNKIEGRYFNFFVYAFIGPSSVEVDRVTKKLHRVAFPLILKCFSFTDAFFDARSADGIDTKNEILTNLYNKYNIGSI